MSSTVYRGFLQGPIVAKSRQCLDYGATMYGVHLLICVISGGATAVLLNPVLLALTTAQCAITVQVGRYQCQQAELLPIPLGSIASPTLVGEGGSLSKYINGSLGRVRSLLPMLTGLLARILRMGSSSGHEMMVPLNSASTVRNTNFSLPVTPKKV